ncbi:MAG: DUF4167 domain-containing protein [Polymorphobacter sp.]
MIRNNQNGRRRGRGGGAGGGGGARPPQGAPSGGNYTPNRGDNRQRGNANQLLEKYKSLARDASQQGDRVTAEYFMQYADHYYRVLNDYRVRENEARPQARRDQDDDGDEGQNYNNGNFNASSDAAPNYGAQSYAARAEGAGEAERDSADGGDEGNDDGGDDDLVAIEPERNSGRDGGRQNGNRDSNRDSRPRDDSRRNRPYNDGNRAEGGRAEGGRNDGGRSAGRQDEPRPEPRAAAEAPARETVRPRREPDLVEAPPVIQGLPPRIELGAESDDLPAVPRRGRGRPRKIVASDGVADAEG